MEKGSNRVLALGSVVLSVGLLFAAFAVVWLTPREAAPTQAQSGDTANKPTQITVRGNGSIGAKPDTLVMNVGTTVQESTVKAAQDKVASAISAMTEKVKAAGIEEKNYRTVQYNVEPVMDYGTPDRGGAMNLPKLIGFRVTNIMEVTFSDPARAPQVLDDLVAAGANTIYNVGYTFADPSHLVKQAYDKAVKDAESRAIRLADLSNMKLGKVVSVTEAAANMPSYGYGGGEKGAAGSAAMIYPGQQSVGVDVIVTYEATTK